LFIILETSYYEIIGDIKTKIDSRREKIEVADRYLSIGLSVFLVFSILFFGVLSGTNINGLNSKKYLTLEHKTYNFFESHYENYPIYGNDDPTPERKIIPITAFLDVCNYINNNTPITAAFFNPSYIIQFRTYCHRQAFLTEKFDGNWAIFNKRFATLYLTRFSDIHKGLTYDELPGQISSFGEPYAIMRQRFLSLNDMDISRLKNKYPGYEYLLTEIDHELPFPKLYVNEYFIVYDLRNTQLF
jgi:hypothetical protein